jgi:DNA-binding CsgD family transcriptional regulator/PAS domain-containing protein
MATIDTEESISRLNSVCDELELPLWLIDLKDFTVRGASKAAACRIGVPPTAFIGRPAVEQLRLEDRPDVLAALNAMSTGAIDFYRSHRQIGPAQSPEALATEWVRAVQWGDERWALVEAAPGSERRQSPLADHLGGEPIDMAVGRTDTDWIIKFVSSDITALLGASPGELIGHPLLEAVDQRDAWRLLDAARGADGACSVSLRLRLRDCSGSWRPLRCVLTSLVASTDIFFILIADHEAPQGKNRAAQLERHLRRIATEVVASGVLDNLGAVPDTAYIEQLATLSIRQREILTRLLRGDRVRAIATELFLSPSTVRNHLATIFRRFAVHSQAELLAKLRDKRSAD